MDFYNVKLSQLDDVAKQIIQAFPDNRIFVFDAEMGAGKTTLITKLCKIIGVKSQVASPTFAIINAYLTNENSEVYHFDFYRLNKIEEAFEIGFYEYLESGNYCFIEWPKLIYSYLPAEFVKIDILQKKDSSLRDIIVNS